MIAAYDCDIAGDGCWPSVRSRRVLLVSGMMKEEFGVRCYSAWACGTSRNVEGIILEVRYLVSERD